MLLTKDNLVRFVREKKYVTPTIVAESFETTTMIGSAALSELSQSKIVSISNIKIGSTPYYYDPLQKICLIELGEKHLSGYDREVFLRLKQHEIVNDNSLSIQEKLAMEKIKDFALPLEVHHEDRTFKFWVWYLRDLNETKKLIIEALNPKQEPQVKTEVVVDKKEKIIKPVSSAPINQVNMQRSQSISQRPVSMRKLDDLDEEFGVDEILSDERSFESKSELGRVQMLHSTQGKKEFKMQNSGENQIENFIEKYLFDNNLKVESKHKTDRGILYTTIYVGNNLEIQIDCFYFSKKPTESEIISFYTSNMKPKVVFIENAQAKFFKLAENIANLNIVNI